MKQEILQELNKRPGINAELVESLYDDAVSDMLEFCNLSKIELKHKTVLKDLLMYRYNTLGVEGISSESYPSVKYSYEGDIPPRIKNKLRSFRRL